MAARARKALVSERALLQRINRALRDERLQVRVSRGDAMWREYGKYYVHDFGRNFIHGWKNLNIEEYGREVGVLADWETVDWEEES